MNSIKKCKGCSLDLPLDSFTACASMRDGRLSYCRPCNNVRKRARRDEKKPQRAAARAQRLQQSAEARLWANIDKSGGSDACWEWVGGKVNGYGVLRVRSKTIGAHRFSFILAKGPVPDGMVVRHRCDNPPCCNPAHLELGTHAENMNDRDTRGRNAKGERSGRAKMTEAEAAEAISMLAAGATMRAVAERFGVKIGTVSHIKIGANWRHIAGNPFVRAPRT